MASLPSLVVNLALDSATFVSGLTKAEYQAKKSADEIKASIEGISSSIETVAAAIGIGLGVDAFKDLVKGAIDAEAQLQLLGDRAGLTGAQLSEFIGVAARSKTDLETVVQASAKLSKALLDFSNVGAKSTEVLKALGFQAKDIPGLLAAPDEALLKVGKSINDLSGGTKAAAALLVLGRGGSQAAALLAELAKQSELVQLRSQAEIDTAKELADRFIDMGVASDTLKTKFSNALIPSLNALLDTVLGLTTGSGGLKDIIDKLAADGSIKRWADDAIAALAGVLDAVKQTGAGIGVVSAYIDLLVAKTNAPSYKVTGTLGFTPEQAAAGEEGVKKAYARLEAAEAKFSDSYVHLIKTDGETIEGAYRLNAAKIEAAINLPINSDQNDRRISSLNTAATAGAAAAAKAAQDAKNKAVQDALNRGNTQKDDPAKAILAGQIKAIEDSIAEEKSVLTSRQEFLSIYFQQGLLSVTQYYDSVQAAQDEHLANTIRDYDREISAQLAYFATLNRSDPKYNIKVQDTQNAIDAIIAKEQKATTDAINQSNLLSARRTLDNQKYADELDELNAKILDLAGNTAKAASIRFNIQTRDLQNKLSVGDNPAAQQQFNLYQAQVDNQNRLNEAAKQFNLILGDINITQGYINIAQQTGAISELTALQQTSDLNKSKLALLQQQLDKARELAAQPYATQDQIQQVHQLELQLAQVAAQTDLVADKFNKTFSDAFSSAFSDFITGTKSAKEAFNDFVKSVTKSISDIASQNIATAIFGKNGLTGGGIGDFFSKVFGGTLGDASKDTGALALTSAATLQSTAATALIASGAALDAAAAALTASAASSAIGSGVSSAGGGFFSDIIGNLFNGVAGAANGTDYAAGGLMLVGERGPELLNVPQGSQITPNEKSRGMKSGSNVSVNVYVPRGTTGPSANQVGVRTGAHVQRALARDG